MKRYSLLLGLVFAFVGAQAARVDRMDPPFWYTGMKNHEVQVMFYGPDIAKADFSLTPYPGVTVKETARVDNPNYLFVYLDVAEGTSPGKLQFTFREGRKKTVQSFELKPRNDKPGAQGFTSADVLYLIMPDRFANGEPANDVLENWGVDRNNGGGHHGGDLQGIRDHLDYLDALGVTAVWLNPVQFNRGNASHGYAISDYYEVDPRLGGNEVYCDFVDAAHRKGLKVVMDMIFNHCGSSHWWLSDIPADDWFNQNDVARKVGEMARQPQPLPQQGQRGPGGWRRLEGLQTTTHYKWTLMDPHAPQSEKDVLVDGWFSGGMPDLNQRNRHLATYLIQNSIWWIEYARIDGVRMDTYPYADYDFMVRWCREIEDEYPDFNIVGEGWYPRNSAAGWWQGGSLVNPSDSRLKTVMDFDLTFTAKREMLQESNTAEGSEAGLFKLYECIAQDFLIPDPNHVLTFLDNHDIARFMEPGEPAWKLKQGLAFLLTTRGIPQIYYGTEIAMGGRDALRADFPGGWAEDSRSAFTAEGRTDFENECWDFASKLLHWRRTSGPVARGKLVHYTPDNATKCYVYARMDDRNTVLVILNGSDREQTVPMGRFREVIGGHTVGVDAVTGEAVDVTSAVKIAPRGVYVLDLATGSPAYAAFDEGLIDRIEPEGWLKEILLRQRDGLTGHPEAMAYPYNSVLWAGELQRDSDRRGADWWRFEQTAYYLDGLTRLGYLLDDKALLDRWQENIEYVLSHPLPFKAGQELPETQPGRPQRNFGAQVSADPRLQERMQRRREREERRRRIVAQDRPEGRLGPETESMAWPFAVFFRAVKAYYEATGDPRIPAALEKNYLSYPVEELGMDRFVVNVEGILWTWSLTRNPALLDLAIKAWDEGASDMTQASALDDSPFQMHGVTMNELLKVPLLLYAYTGEGKYLEAALHAEAKMEGPNMLVDGVNSSSEALAGNDPLASHETCDVSDYTWTMGYYLMATGDGAWADRIENAIFNAGLGSITKDFRSMQYFSCPNQVIATGNSNHNRFKHGLTWMAYRPIHETECCIGNLHRYMPNYVARMWLKDGKGQPVAALYGPSSVEYDLGDGVTVRIKEETEYPFEEQVRFTFHFFRNGTPLSTPVPMDFTYRIPAWCSLGEKGFRTESRSWKSGDSFTVSLPMHIEQVANPHGGLSFRRGPVLYAYAVPADVQEDTRIYDNLAGKVSANPDFKSWSMVPSGPWNYALVAGRLQETALVKTGAGGFPFDPENVPFKLRVPVVRVSGWTLEEGRYTPPLPETVVPESGEVSFIELVPYGSTTLRLTIFPTYQNNH